MKYLLPFLLLLSFNLYANELIMNPDISGQTAVVITCEYPEPREQINTIIFYRDYGDGRMGYLSNNRYACQYVVYLQPLPDGVYVYRNMVAYLNGDVSEISTDSVTVTIDRTVKARASFNLIGIAN